RQALARTLGVEPVDLLAAWDDTRADAVVGVLENTRQRIAEVARRLRARITAATLDEEARLDDAMWLDCARLYPEAAALLEAINAVGLRVAIVANGPSQLSPLKNQ